MFNYLSKEKFYTFIPFTIFKALSEETSCAFIFSLHSIETKQPVENSFYFTAKKLSSNWYFVLAVNNVEMSMARVTQSKLERHKSRIKYFARIINQLKSLQFLFWGYINSFIIYKLQYGCSTYFFRKRVSIFRILIITISPVSSPFLHLGSKSSLQRPV
jgi:hypothetical protein